jgi:hypothetical protein
VTDAGRWLIKVEGGRRYARISIDLYQIPFDLTLKGIRKVERIITSYILSRRTHSKIVKQCFCIGPTYIEFTALREDAPHLLRR